MSPDEADKWHRKRNAEGQSIYLIKPTVWLQQGHQQVLRGSRQVGLCYHLPGCLLWSAAQIGSGGQSDSGRRSAGKAMAAAPLILEPKGIASKLRWYICCRLTSAFFQAIKMYLWKINKKRPKSQGGLWGMWASTYSPAQKRSLLTCWEEKKAQKSLERKGSCTESMCLPAQL